MDPAFEIAVSRQHRRDGQAAVDDGLGDRFGQRSRVTDARRAAIAHQAEAKPVEFALQAGRLKVIGHHLACPAPGRSSPTAWS